MVGRCGVFFVTVVEDSGPAVTATNGNKFGSDMHGTGIKLYGDILISSVMYGS